MNKNSIVVAVVLLVLAAAACDEKKSETPAKPVPAEKSKVKAIGEAAVQAGKAGKLGAEGLAEAAAEKTNWEIKVEGVEAKNLAGGMVMGQTVGPQAMYTLGGAKAMINISLKGVKKHETGTFDPYNFTIMWTDEKLSCGYSSLNKEDIDFQMVVKEKGDGVRAEFEGDMLCSTIGKPGARKSAKIKGWFED